MRLHPRRWYGVELQCMIVTNQFCVTIFKLTEEKIGAGHANKS